jgi:hypothetical protein
MVNDLLYSVKARGCDAFASFDRRLASGATKLCDIEARAV